MEMLPRHVTGLDGVTEADGANPASYRDSIFSSPVEDTWNDSQRSRLVIVIVLLVFLAAIAATGLADLRLYFETWADLSFLGILFCFMFVKGLRNHHDVVLTTIGITVLLYIAICISIILRTQNSASRFSETGSSRTEAVSLLLGVARMIASPIILVCSVQMIGVSDGAIIAAMGTVCVSSAVTLVFLCIRLLAEDDWVMIIVLMFAFTAWAITTMMILTHNRFARTILMEMRILEELKSEDVKHEADVAQQEKIDHVIRYIFHEIRNPINNITLAADLANDMATKQNVGKSLPYLINSIKWAADAANHVLNDAQSVQELQEGHFKFLRKPFELVETHMQCIQMFESQITSKKIHLETSVDKSLDTVVVMGDPHRIKQAFSNLLSNAIDFTPLSGTVQLAIARLEPITNSPVSDTATTTDVLDSVHVMVSVTDSGPGIPEEEQSKIFKPWSQIRTGHHETARGSGLGLTLCKEFIEKGHGGRVGFESQPGRTIFFFELNLPLCQMLSGTTTRSFGGKFSGFSSLSDNRESEEADVLVVDDSSITRLLLTKTLDQLGVTHQAVENGQQAVDLILGPAPLKCKVIFMDKEMPVMDGYEATRQLRAANFQGKIIGITGNAMQEQIASFIECGADEVLPKPINRVTIQRVLQAHSIILPKVPP